MSITINIITDRTKDLEKLLKAIAEFTGASISRINTQLSIEFMQKEKK